MKHAVNGGAACLRARLPGRLAARYRSGSKIRIMSPESPCEPLTRFNWQAPYSSAPVSLGEHLH